MKKIKLYPFIGIVIFLLISINAYSQIGGIRLNEIQSMNGNTITDEDGDNEDWIEIKNTSAVNNINMLNWGLSDDPNNIFKWQFPNITMKPNDRMLIFASGKNRKTYVHHWECGVYAESFWSYYVDPSGVSSSWKNATYDDSQWSVGKGGFGYGDDDDFTTFAPCISVYVRQKFQVDTSKISTAIFSIDYDDGFVAYINGHEIARNNMANTPPAWNDASITDNEAKIYQNLQPEHYVISEAVLKSYLLPYPAQNVLAVEVHNASTSSSDMTVLPFLTFGVNSSQTLFPGTSLPYWFSYLPFNFHTNFKIDNLGETITLTKIGFPNMQADQISTGNILYNASLARIPDGTGMWKIAYPATPNQSNDNSASYSGFTPKPVISLNSGKYSSTQTVTITSSAPSQYSEIRYTLNGNIPQNTDNIYNGSIQISSSAVLKARVFSKNSTLYQNFPGGIAQATYIINDPTLLPIVSVTMDSLDLWDATTGIYVLGPNALPNYPHKKANFWQNWDRSSHADFIDVAGNIKFSADGTMGIFGNYTRAKPQKSFDFKTKPLYDSSSIVYQIFPDRNKVNFNNFVMRMGGSDWMKAHLRDEYFHKVLFNANVEAISHRAVTGFLNGKYWGVYHLREKNDEKYLAEKYGYNNDSIDQLKVSGIDVAANGDLNAFNSMVSYFKTANLTTTANFNIAQQYWDMDNLMSYYAAEIYAANDDWLSVYMNGNIREYWVNNIKLYRHRNPNAKWRYQLHDVDQGLLSGKLNDTTLNLVVNYPENNNHTIILQKFLQNSDFKRRFINKFMDMFNTSLKTDSMYKALNEFKAELQPEMSRMVAQWPTNPGMGGVSNNSVTVWNSHITDIENFIKNRYKIVIKQLITRYSLGSSSDTIHISIRSASPSMGKVKLNSLPPKTSKWSGLYLKGNPLEAIAIAEPGYMFDSWKLCGTSITASNSQNMTLIQAFKEGDSIVATFKIAPNITITELNYKSDPTKDAKDWIEIKNYGPSTMNVANWKLKQVSTGLTYTIPAGTVINSGGYLALVQDTFFFKNQHPGVNNRLGPTFLDFNDAGEELHLLDATNNVILRLVYSDTATWPDCAKGYGRTLQLINQTYNINSGASWTCGCMGGSPGKDILPCPEKLVFSEVNYNSAQLYDIGDWVELYNKDVVPMDLSGWMFRDGKDYHSFVLPQGTVIGAKGYLILVQDLPRFNSFFPTSTYPYLIDMQKGSFNWNLAPDKDVLRLYNSSGKIYQSMVYKDNTPWPTGADGLGYTLELMNPDYNPTSPYSWTTNCLKGSPGISYPNCNIGIDENNKDFVFKVYPNPAFDFITIETYNFNAKDALFQIYDLQGRLVSYEKLHNNDKQKIMINQLQNGMYIFRIISSGIVIGSGKLLKR